MKSRFDGAVAVVTGGGQGIGEGIVRRLASEGARVAVADIRIENARRVSEAVTRTGGDARPIQLNVEDPDNVATLGERVAAEFGEPHRMLVCNAGVQTFRHAVELPVAEWDRVLDVNARGTLLCLQDAAGSMPDGSAIVAMASIQGRIGGPYYPHYSASKAAVLSLVKSFAMALAPRAIRVNSVAPGIIATPLWDDADRELSKLRAAEPGVARDERIAAVPLGRAGTPEDVAAAVSFLLSRDAAYITGECIHVCGGDVML